MESLHLLCYYTSHLTKFKVQVKSGYISARARATKAAPLTCSAYLVTRMHRLLCGNAPTPILCRAERKLTPEFLKVSSDLSECRARGSRRPRAFVQWRPQSGARRPPCRSRHPETRAPACEPGVPRPHGATCPMPPTQISTPSPKSSCAPSREPCSATRLWWSTLGTRTRGCRV